METAAGQSEGTSDISTSPGVGHESGGKKAGGSILDEYGAPRQFLRCFAWRETGRMAESVFQRRHMTLDSYVRRYYFSKSLREHK
jgi:hypothetical protein